MELEQGSGGSCWTRHYLLFSGKLKVLWALREGKGREPGEQSDSQDPEKQLCIVQEVFQYYNHHYWPDGTMAEHQPFSKHKNLPNK